MNVHEVGGAMREWMEKGASLGVYGPLMNDDGIMKGLLRLLVRLANYVWTLIEQGR